MSSRFQLLCLSSLLLAACPNPNYCPDQASATCPNNSACQSDRDCGGEAPVCDTTGTMMCVQCTAEKDAACSGVTPVCLNNACQACTAHSQCSGSDVCLPDGTCAEAAQVAYIEAGGVGASPCMKEMPCGTLQEGIDSGRPLVKIAAGVLADDQGTTIDGRSVRIFAEANAKLERTGDGALLTVQGIGAGVEIYDLEIVISSGDRTGLFLSGGTRASLVRTSITGSTVEGIVSQNAILLIAQSTISGNRGGGIFSTGGSLMVSQSTISDNFAGGIFSMGGALTVSQSTISGNRFGGILAEGGTFSVIGNFFFKNGSEGSSAGGISISDSEGLLNRLEFNSFHQNQTHDGIGAAVQCAVGQFTARNNILSGNGTVTNMEQVGGSCTHEYSIVRPGSLPSGAGNSSADPRFVSASTGDLHLQPGSPALGMAAPSSDLGGLAARDADGDMRSAPADIGADEVP